MSPQRDLEQRAAYARENEQRPERKRAKRMWEDENDRRPCVRCGEPKAAGDHRRKGALGRCARCRLDDDAERKRGRRQSIQTMWAAGASREEIAQALGSTSNAVGTEIAHMRADGWDVPHRHRGSYVEAA